MSGPESTSSGSSVLRYLYWSSEKLTPRQFVEKYSLPRLVKISDSSQAVSNVDLSQPLVLYRSYRSTNVQAKNLKLSRSGKWKEIGSGVVVPESYTGWFLLVSENGRMAQSMNSIEQIAKARLNYFLTRFDIRAYKLSDSKDAKGKMYVKTTARSGHILKLLGVFEDLNAKKNSKLSVIGRMSSGFSPSTKYAQCLNHSNEVIYIPFSVTGHFYAVAGRDSKDPNHVYLFSHLLRNHKLPIKAHLCCGYLPTVPRNFTGTLLLERFQQEEVLLACTLSREPSFLEIELDSKFLLTRAMEEDYLVKTPLFQAALSFCRSRGELWRRQMKVAHHVFPLPELRRCSSLNSSSDSATRDKNSAKDKHRRQTFSHSIDRSSVESVPPEEAPYAHVFDAIAEENIYAEICEQEQEYCVKVAFSGSSNGTFSGTASSSDPSGPEDLY